MKSNEISLLGAMLANPVRREMLLLLINPSESPKGWTDMKMKVSDAVDKEITDGAINWYLKDLQARYVIQKDEKTKLYSLTELGENIARTIKKISDELKES